MPNYTVLSPIKYKGEVTKSGEIEMPEKVAAPLLANGHLALPSATPVAEPVKPKGKGGK